MVGGSYLRGNTELDDGGKVDSYPKAHTQGV